MAKYELNAKITACTELTEELRLLRVAPLVGACAEFEPGQYVEIAVPSPEELNGEVKLLRRAYSIASAKTVRDYFELFIIRVEGGAVTPRLWKLNVGDELWMNPLVKGKFTLEHIPTGKDLIFVSTGTGNAPFMSMVRSFKGQNRWRRCVFIHGTRRASDLAFRDELEALAKTDPSLVYLPALTREPDDSPWTGLRGRVQGILEPKRYEELVGAKLDPKDCQIFLCGNPAMIDSVVAELQTHGFKEHHKKDPGQIHLERYW